MVIGYAVGALTNIVPGSGHLRDQYTPTDSHDYNSGLRTSDNVAAATGSVLIKAGLGGMAGGSAMMAAGVAVTLSSGGTLAVAGTPVAAAGGELVAVGAASTTAGVVLMANSAENKSGGYERGKNSNQSKGQKPKSPNQLKQDIERGRAPISIKRCDLKKDNDKSHVHFKDGNALYKDGTWKHGGRELTNKEKDFLKRYDWKTK